MDSETKKMHNEGCAPTVSGHEKKAQLLPEHPRQDDELLPGGLRLPERLPIGNLKEEIKQEPISPERKVSFILRF